MGGHVSSLHVISPFSAAQQHTWTLRLIMYIVTHLINMEVLNITIGLVYTVSVLPPALVLGALGSLDLDVWCLG